MGEGALVVALLQLWAVSPLSGTYFERKIYNSIADTEMK